MAMQIGQPPGPAAKLAIHFGRGAARQVDSMLARQNLSGMPVHRRGISGGAIGYLGDAGMPSRGNACLFTGLPINGPDVACIVDAEAAERVFPQYDGAFAGVFWDAGQEVLVVVTDCLGMQPLYLHRTDDGLTLVSETKALRGEPDLAAWGAFISIGHPIGARSLMAGLERVPPASILRYDSARDELKIQRYFEWPSASESWRDYDFLGALERDVLGYAAYGDPGTVLLSGGFDSRLLLFLLRRARIPVDALIVAHDDEFGDTDGRLAEKIARIAAAPYRKVHPPTDFFSSPAYLRYLVASDVGFPSLDLFIAKVASQIDAPAVWDGLVPGFAFMPLHQPEGGFDAYLRQEVRGPDSVIWKAAASLFKREVVEVMHEGFKDDLCAEVERLPQDMHGLARFVIENRSRNRAAMNPLKVYANLTRAFTPGLSKDFMIHAATIPFDEKRNAGFYRKLFAKLDPRALAVPFLSGGDLVKSGRNDRAWHAERLRAGYHVFRSRHPRLFGHGQDSRAARSSFLGGHLFEDDDRWLNPGAREKLQSTRNDNYLVWKLLLHWKVWRWVHEGRLDTNLGPHCVRCMPNARGDSRSID
ncbi:MAG: hypothetical protein KJS83_11310 [Xanthomonadaceae bacterium]|nr:hypothetical protein [Xanthomonadaceae bacterium]